MQKQNFVQKANFISQKTRDVFSLCATLVLCAFITLMFALIPVKQKKYQEIRIQLNAPEEKVVEKITPKEEPIIQETEIAKKQETPSTTKAQVKPETKKAEPKPAAKPIEKPAPAKPTPRPEPVYHKSMDELLEQTTARKTTQNTNWDDSAFDESFTSEASTQTSNTKTSTQRANNVQDEFSGTAATSNKATSQTQINSGRNYSQSASQNQTASSQTSSALETISATQFNEREISDSGVYYAANSMKSSRLPKSTSPIVYNSELEKLIIRNFQGKISLQIDSYGFVIPSSITVTAEKGELPPLVEQDLKRQISKWTFESGTGIGQTSFNYQIIVE